MKKTQLEKIRKDFESMDMSRYHILTYDELLRVNGGSGSDDDSEDAEDSLGSGEPESGESSQTATETTAVSGACAPTGEDEPEEEDFHVTSHAEVANMEPGETITRSDGSEYTVNQGDIDYEQNYCNEHGIDWQNGGKEESDAPASGNLPTEEESGNADSASSTAEVGGSQRQDATNGAVANAEIADSKEPVENGEPKSNGENTGTVTTEDSKNSANETSHPMSSGHSEKSGSGFLGGVSDFFSSVKDWFCGTFGINKEASVTNKTGDTIVIKPEDHDAPYVLLKNDKTYKGDIDGIIFPDGTVTKNHGKSNYIAQIDKNGNYKVSGGEFWDFAGNVKKSELNKTNSPKSRQ